MTLLTKNDTPDWAALASGVHKAAWPDTVAAPCVCARSVFGAALPEAGCGVSAGL